MNAKVTGRIRWKEIDDRSDFYFVGNYLGKEKLCKLQQEWEIIKIVNETSYIEYEWHDVIFEH
jgi:hypothetical protein